jgi:hypothetical protein
MIDGEFEDSKQPFMLGDSMPKPDEGDILILKPNPQHPNEDLPTRVKVLYTWDSLAESWDPVGETAWAQHEVNDLMGYRGRWYALVCEPLDDTVSWSVASYEVASTE